MLFITDKEWEEFTYSCLGEELQGHKFFVDQV
jgi:hypothetical protein